MQRADGVVELLTALVVAAHALAQHAQKPGIGDVAHPLLLCGHGQGFQGVEQAPGVAIGVGDQAIYCYAFNSWQRLLRLRQSHNFL